MWIAFEIYAKFKFSKELNEKPSWKISSRYAWYKRDIDIKAGGERNDN